MDPKLTSLKLKLVGVTTLLAVGPSDPVGGCATHHSHAYIAQDGMRQPGRPVASRFTIGQALGRKLVVYHMVTTVHPLSLDTALCER